MAALCYVGDYTPEVRCHGYRYGVCNSHEWLVGEEMGGSAVLVAIRAVGVSLSRLLPSWFSHDTVDCDDTQKRERETREREREKEEEARRDCCCLDAHVPVSLLLLLRFSSGTGIYDTFGFGHIT